VQVQGRVRLLHDGVFFELLPRHGGRLRNNQGLTAVVETPEGDTIVLTSLRMSPFSLEQILSLGIKPEQKRVLIAKGAVAPRAAYEPVSARLIEVDTAGITAANPASFHYQHRRKPMFPFERDAVYSPAAES
jgi:microcystin degradation protein MlrC